MDHNGVKLVVTLPNEPLITPLRYTCVPQPVDDLRANILPLTSVIFVPTRFPSELVIVTLFASEALKFEVVDVDSAIACNNLALFV